MFKKTLAAAACTAALAGFAGTSFAADVTLYGIVDLGLTYKHVDSDKANEDATDTFALSSGNYSGSRFGLKGSEDVGNGAKVGFILENGFSADDGTIAQNGRLFGRQAYVYVNGSFGELALGRIGALASANGTYGLLGGLSPFGASFAGTVEYSTYYVGGLRLDNTVTYQTPTFAGFTAYAQYSFDANTAQDDTWDSVEGKTTANRYYAVGVTYKAGGLDLAAVLDGYNWAAAQNHTATEKFDDGYSFTLGGSYNFQVARVYLSGQYFDNMLSSDKDPAGSADQKTNSYGPLGTYYGNTKPYQGYTFQAGVDAPVLGGTALFAVGYSDTEQCDAEAGVEKLEVNRFGASVGYIYNLSKRTSLYGVAGYYQDKVKNDGAKEDRDPNTTTVTVGVRHTF